MTWRYHLLALPSRQWLDRDLHPLTGVSITECVNAPASISGLIPIEHRIPGLVEWGAMLIAEQDGKKPIAAIVDRLERDGQQLSIESGGFSMYPTGMPWLGEDYAGVQVDPLDVVRLAWEHLQSYDDGDLRVTVDSTKSPVRVGTEPEQKEFTTDDGEEVSFESGPFRLAWWNTDDLGRVIDDLATDTPFEYREESAWDGEEITHRLRLGYPKLGARRENLRFEVGVNVTVPPPLAPGEYASEVQLFGAGEGSSKVRAHTTQDTGRLRRVYTSTDKSLTSKTAAGRAARPMLDRLAGSPLKFDSVQITDHPNARPGTYEPGDEIRIVGDAGWAELDHWCRIMAITTTPEDGAISLEVETL